VFEVVVLPSLLLKDVHDDIAVVQRHPATVTPALLAQRLATCELGQPLNLFGNSPDLAVVTPGNDDQGVERVNQLTAVENRRVQANLFGGTGNGRFQQFVS
jgi:hypothetical protein